MFNYLGESCPICNRPFEEGDDIVVCPDCGTPHHRDCYTAEGHCANTARHADGYDYTLAHRRREEQRQYPADSVRLCPGCGYEVQPDATFCNHCGMPQPPANKSEPPQDSLFPRYGERGGEPGPRGSDDDRFFGFAPEPLPAGSTIDDVSVEDWRLYIGRGAPYYLNNFRMQDITGRKTALTLSAMLFPSYYFAYRKLWPVAIISFFAGVLISFPSLLLMMESQNLLTLTHSAFWLSISDYLSYAGTLVNVLWGLYAVRLYRNYSGRRIRGTKVKSDSAQSYRARLARLSGPSVLAAVGVFFLHVLIATFTLFFGPSLF